MELISGGSVLASERPGAQRLAFGVYELDLTSGELRKAGRLVNLSPQPFRILALLAMRPGEVVTREEIRCQVWGNDTFVDFDKGLNFAIKRIREALGDDADSPRYIQTLPRRGYRFLPSVNFARLGTTAIADSVGNQEVLPQRDQPPGKVQDPSQATSVEARPSTPPGQPEAERTSPEVHTRTGAHHPLLSWALAGATLVLAALLAFLFMNARPAPTQPTLIEFQIQPPEGTRLGAFALSPDGRQLAFVAARPPDGPRQLWIRSLRNPVARPLAGTEGASSPFWSPDSRYLAFYAHQSLNKLDARGGSVKKICSASAVSGYRSGSWNGEGVILFSQSLDGGLFRVSAAGGTPSLLTALGRPGGVMQNMVSQFLPDGRHFLYYTAGAAPDGIHPVSIASLDMRVTRSLLMANSRPLYALPGYLLFLRGRDLVAQPFSVKRQALSGHAALIAQNVTTFSVSETKTLAYSAARLPQTRLTWFDRGGKKLGNVGPPDFYTNPALSPDGRRLAVSVGIPGMRGIWVFDLKRGTESRLTFNPADNTNPTWSADGRRILFTSARDGQRDIFEKASNGLGSAQLVFQSKHQAKGVDSWSNGGRYVIYDLSITPSALWALPLFGSKKPFPFVQGAYDAKQAVFSPHGRYVAYGSDETGKQQVYVRTFPQPSGKWQISVNGGADPAWRADGKELFYLEGNKMMAVDVDTTSGAFHAGAPKPLFTTQPEVNLQDFRDRYVASPDGQRFLIVTPVVESAAPPVPITVVVNWPTLLRTGSK